jgi:hypothetical protein
MRNFSVFDGSLSLEGLDLRLSPSSLFAGGVHVHPHFHHVPPHFGHVMDSDPLPDPEPSPGQDPGMDTPVTPPPLPPSGPVGPGTT